MSSTEHAHGTPLRTLCLWSALVVATLATLFLGERGGSLMAVALLLIATLKGSVVALEFMALRHAGMLWRGLVIGWLLLVCSLIAFAYWKGA